MAEPYSPQAVIIVGAGAMSASIAGAIDALNAASPDRPPWRLLGFLDDDETLHGTRVADRAVLGPILPNYPEALYVIGIASYRNRGARESVAARLALAEDRYATIVHPGAFVSPHARLGAGSVVLQGAVVEHGASVGSHVLISPLSIVSHDVELENFVTLAQRATVCGSVTAGAGAYVGAGAIVRDGVCVGKGALVGIGSVVTRGVAPGETVFGNPARALRSRRR